MSHKSPHVFSEQVRFEDVDAMAMVYHPVYLCYLERARCQYLIDQKASFKSMLTSGFGIVVAHAEMKFIRPLQLEDRFVVATQVDKLVKSVLYMTQVIAFEADDVVDKVLKEDLRAIKSLRFYAHLKLSIISMQSGTLATPPAWIAEALLGPSYSPR